MCVCVCVCVHVNTVDEHHHARGLRQTLSEACDASQLARVKTFISTMDLGLESSMVYYQERLPLIAAVVVSLVQKMLRRAWCTQY